MAPGSRLRVNLGDPLPNVNGHEKALVLTFNRTIRVPEDGTTYDLPPGLGNLPFYSIAHYQDTLPDVLSITASFPTTESPLCQGSTINIVLNLWGGGVLQLADFNPNNAEMSIGAGGFVSQSILRDPHASIAWDSESTIIFNIQLLNTTVFESVTGRAPPPSPITAESYAAAGLPFFALPTEVNSGIKGLFSDVKGIHEIDVAKGLVPMKPKFKYKGPARGKGWKKELKFPTVQLDNSGNPPEFLSVETITQQLDGWGFT